MIPFKNYWIFYMHAYVYQYICIYASAYIYINIYTHIHIHVGLPQGVIIQKHGCCLPRILPASALPDRPASAASAQGSTSMGSNISLPPAASNMWNDGPWRFSSWWWWNNGNGVCGVFYVSFVTSVRIWMEYRHVWFVSWFWTWKIIQQLADWQ